MTDSVWPWEQVAPENQGIRAGDLLTVSAGLEWNEKYLNSMYTFFVSKRITEASGMTTLQFAEEYLWGTDIGDPLFTYLEQAGAFLAMGVHDQRILILPELDTVVVITADQGDGSRCDILIRDYILPAL